MGITEKDILKTVLKVPQLEEQLDNIANKGTTVEVLERVTKEEIDRQVADGTIANLTIADNSITVNKIGFFDDVEEGEEFKIIITKGLVIHLDASIREGNKLIDNSDNKYNITLENFNGSFGSKYINFNGTGGKGIINIPSTNIYTHEFVINQRATSSRCSALSSLNYNSSAGMVAYYGTSTNLNYGISGQGRGNLLLGKDLIPIGVKTHVVITFDTTINKFRTYKNGILFNESAVVSNYNPTVTSIGIGIWATNFSENDLNADVYMVRAYNRTLTHEEILNNYNNEMGV